jgi:hypothetical protein
MTSDATGIIEALGIRKTSESASSENPYWRQTITASWATDETWVRTIIVEWSGASGSVRFAVNRKSWDLALRRYTPRSLRPRNGEIVARMMRSGSWLNRFFGGFPLQCVSSAGEHLGSLLGGMEFKLEGIRHDPRPPHILSTIPTHFKCEVGDIEVNRRSVVIRPVVVGHHYFFCLLSAHYFDRMVANS